MRHPGLRCGGRRLRSGFSLVEVLVCLGILAMLAALLLPAVQQARESARGVQCRSNLRQIGLAVQAYHEVYNVFPAPWGMVDWSLPFLFQRQYSSFSQILPHLEQSPLHSSINFDMPLHDFMMPFPYPEWARAANRTATATRLDVLLCPSDGGRPVGGVAGTNYRANLGTDRSFVSVDGPYMNIFAHTSYSDIRDGASQTVGYSEKLRGPGPGGRLDLRSVMVVGGLGAESTTAESLARCRQGATLPLEIYWTGGSCWMVGTLSQTHYNHAIGPNASLADCVSRGTNPINGHVGARSNHPGGIHALFVDGSCRFIQETVDFELWRSIGSRNGGELASLPD